MPVCVQVRCTAGGRMLWPCLPRLLLLCLVCQKFRCALRHVSDSSRSPQVMSESILSLIDLNISSCSISSAFIGGTLSLASFRTEFGLTDDARTRLSANIGVFQISITDIKVLTPAVQYQLSKAVAFSGQSTMSLTARVDGSCLCLRHQCSFRLPHPYSSRSQAWSHDRVSVAHERSEAIAHQSSQWYSVLDRRCHSNCISW